MMMKYLFLPIESHSDLGFGALAAEYDKAAKILEENKKHSTYLETLPLFYLYRHSYELYLKSIVIILHKIIKSPFEDEYNPQITINNNKPKNIFKIHSLQDLFNYYLQIIETNKEIFQIEGKTDWTLTPKKLINGVNEIEKLDRKSSYFRYPITKKNGIDIEKSPMEKGSVDNIFPEDSKKKVFSIVFVDKDKNPLQVFNRKDDSKLIEKQIGIFKDVLDNLTGASVGLRIEYLDGF